MFKGISLASASDTISQINTDDHFRKKINDYKTQRERDFYSLSSFFLHEEILDAKKISERLFPTINADIFLSHSHTDEDQAIILALLLEETLGVKVFIDSCVWAYADDLLRDIDNKYCKWPSGSYSYEMRNFSTAHVHMILNSALHAMIDKAELFIFLETENSAPLKDYLDGDKTFSPWIFSELMFSSVVSRRTPERYLAKKSTTLEERAGTEMLIAKSLRVAHPIYTDHLSKVNSADFLKHIIECKKSETLGVNFLESTYKKFSVC